MSPTSWQFWVIGLSMGLLSGVGLRLALIRLTTLMGEPEAVGSEQAVESIRLPKLWPEGLAIALTLALLSWWGATPTFFAAVILLTTLVTLALIDYRYYLLPDLITLPLLWLGLVVNLFGVFTDLASAVVGTVAGYLSLWAVYHIFLRLTGKAGMGHGDFKMLAMLGAWLGWQVLPQLLLIAALSGVVVGLALRWVGRMGQEQPLPFGVFLALAGVIQLLLTA
ncbi:leader peptidase (prepilin peptidase) / N-methyltransferase [Ectothiorhodosinus mongolicus]|uniref:Prepilin leader peptidase/N-methyltransferase n=1 Tax=Ectothiorhodosinus mongolicus TaxID=233100 RepID=A0A1R3VVB4_9GAMM|nr:A24 family peptidase [Ectothiorhodosinus mongolicus]ULX56896.1 prepilin peptidase [Ectothiorhodosinus mongolicus]SIT68867.1 leader peptidase (prepilin peptidase) / N-methyltransferase [Ectothiorhodosinus mongolicus]